MTAPQAVMSPWVRMAQDAAREWFREHPDALRADFMAWAEAYEVQEVLRAGFGWQPGDPVPVKVQEALDAAWTGLMAARAVEERRRAAVGDGWPQNPRHAAPRSPVAGTAGLGAGVAPSEWRDGLQRTGGAA